MGCAFSKVHVEKVTSFAPSGRYANFKRWIGRKRRAMFRPSVRMTRVEPFKNESRSQSSVLSFRSTELSDYMGDNNGSATPVSPWSTSVVPPSNARCETRIIRHGRISEAVPEISDYQEEEEASGSEVLDSRPAPRGSLSHRRNDNIQLLRDIMTLEGKRISKDEAEDMLDTIKSKVESERRMRGRQTGHDEEEREMDLKGILQVKPIRTPTPVPNLTQSKNRYQQMKEECLAFLKAEEARMKREKEEEAQSEEEEDEYEEEEEEEDDEQWEDEVIEINESSQVSEEEEAQSGEEEEENAQDGEQWEEEIIEIDESSQVSQEEGKGEEEEEAGVKPKYANSTEELEVTINQIFKRWNLSMPVNNQGEIAAISETIRSTVSRAASARPNTAGHRVVTPSTNQPLSSPTTTSASGAVNRASRERPARPNAARLPRTPANAGIGPQTPGSPQF